MQITHEESFSDGSGWAAVAVVRGMTISARYVAGNLNVTPAAYRLGGAPRVPAWVLKYVRAWAEKRVAALGEAWHAAHRELYGV